MDTLSRTRCPALRARDVRGWEEAAGPAHLRWMSRQHRPSHRPARHVTLPATGYFTPQQAAELLGVSVHTLEKWRRAGYEGVGPRYRLHGRHVRYDPRDLLEWSESKVVA